MVRLSYQLDTVRPGLGSYVLTLNKWARGSHVSWTGSGKSRHPIRNSRMLFLVRLSFTTSTKYCGLSLLDVSNMLPLLRITPDFPPVEFSPTHFPSADLNFSLTDVPPASSKVVLTLLPLPPSPACSWNPFNWKRRFGAKSHRWRVGRVERSNCCGT